MISSMELSMGNNIYLKIVDEYNIQGQTLIDYTNIYNLSRLTKHL